VAGTWVEPEQDPRSAFADPEGEWATLVGYLRHYRLTIELKCEDLDAEQLARRSVPPSTMSLLGLVRHLARVEHNWFRRVLDGQSGIDRIFWSAEDDDLDFNAAEPTQACVDDAFASWQREIGKAEEWFAGVPESGLGRELPIAGHPEDEVSIRDLVVHMIEEYARHCGHADLLRECIDGRTGQ